MTSDMLSGPDLGAGYLHQLTFDRNDDGSTSFTFHAQVGGMDAGGPPLGKIESVGYTQTPTYCFLGGPGCRHRQFELPFEETARVRFAYNRMRFTLTAMLNPESETTRAKSVESGLREVARRLEEPLAAERIPWWLGGSGAAWVRGAALVPRDLDFGTSRSGVPRIAELLGEYLIEPAARTSWPGGKRLLAGRAFVGTLNSGVRVEWGIAEDDTVAKGLDREWLPIVTPGLERIQWEGLNIPVTRPEFSLVRKFLENPSSPLVDTLAELLRQIHVDEGLLDSLMAESSISAAQRSELRRRVVG